MSKNIVGHGTITMRVHREIISYFSAGLYRNFGRAVKELVSNAYDAKATEVKMRLDLLNNRLIVRDNGIGMGIEELQEKFMAVGFPTPLDENIDELGRKRVGTFGIGSISVFPYCEKLTVITKKRKSDRTVELNIHAGRFFKGETFILEKEMEEAKFPYTTTISDLPYEQGETIIILDQLKPHVINDLRKEERSLSVSIEKLSGFEKFKWTLQQYCPLEYPQDQHELSDFFAVSGRVPLRVWLDGEELFRNVPSGARILDKGETGFGDIKVKYVIMTPFSPVRPIEMKGLQIRLRNVGIGMPKDFDVGELTGKVAGKLNYLCGEVHIVEGLANYLMIDRDSFSYTNDVSNFDSFFRRQLIKWNDFLESKSAQDKDLYEGLSETLGSERVVQELQNADIIQFPKERLRISQSSISKSKRRRVNPKSPARGLWTYFQAIKA